MTVSTTSKIASRTRPVQSLMLAAFILGACGSTVTPPGPAVSAHAPATSAVPSTAAPSRNASPALMPSSQPLTPASIISLPDASDAIPIIAVGDDVWIGVDGAIIHVTGSTNAQRRIAVPAMRTGNGSLAMASDGLWIADWAGNRIERLDPATGRVELEADAPGPVGFIVQGDSLWVGSERNVTIYPVDRKTGKLGAKVGSAPGATTGLGQFWQGAAGGDIITRLDPATGKVLGTVAVPAGSGCSVGGAFPDNVWAGCGKFPGMENPAGEVVARIDPATSTVVTTARLPIFGGVVIANGVPWFFVPRKGAATTETSLVAADPATGVLLAARDLGPLDLDVPVVTASALWLSDEQGRRVVRYDLATLRP
jgi:hypothetical protein